MAPCWAFGEGPETPKGYEDIGHVYNSQLAAIDVGAATSKNTAIQLQIKQGSEFICRNLFFWVTADSGAVGDVQVRVRTASGYIFTDDWIRYGILNGVPVPKDWQIAAGETVIIDLVLIDYSGTGNIYVQAFASGVKRRRA
jgi:hypothetical protein